MNSIPKELKALPNWVCWRYQDRTNRQTGEIRRTKVPCQSNGRNAKPNDSRTWSSFDAVSKADGFDGIGFMFDGQYFGVDLDHVIDEAGTLAPEAAEIVRRLNSYTEYSPSGTGLHILCKGALPSERGRRKGFVEVYGKGRFFTVTGKPYGKPCPVREAQDAAQWILTQYFSEKSSAQDDALLERIRHSRQGADFEKLWQGDTSGYNGDWSAADLALCNMLAFWTGRDAERMDALFRQSGLMRPKWDEKHGAQTYGEMTIGKAIKDTRTCYGEKPPMSDAGSCFHRFEEAYEGIPGYCVRGGQTFSETRKQDGSIERRLLSDFAALPVEAIARDDGAEVRQEFVLEGVSSSGKKLPPIHVPAAKFSGMTWALEGWGLDANFQPGQTVKEKLRHAIQSAGANTAKARTVYTHTGWRQIDGQWAYLYHGGAVGLPDVSVELDSALTSFALPDAGSSMRPSLRLMDVLPSHVALPLLGQMYLAPLCEFLERAGCAPMHTLFLAGTSGAKKSTAAALALAHFGSSFKYDHMPASFRDTGNALRRKAFLLKDMPLLVYDLHPTADRRESSRMSETAQTMARAWGDRAERGRMRADLSIQTAQPPRGVGVMTGEDLPDIGESGLARFFLVDVKPGDIHITPELTELQRQATQEALSGAMRSYIEWLLPQVEAMPDRLSREYERLRELARQRLTGVHDRQPGAVAALLLGLRMMLQCMVDRGELEEAQARHIEEQALATFSALAWEQGHATRQENPVRLFLETLNELVIARKASLQIVAKDGAAELHYSQEPVGYMDDQYLYLLPTMAYKAVFEAQQGMGRSFPLSRPTLWKRAAEQGYALPETKTKAFLGRSVRVVWFRLDRLKEEKLFEIEKSSTEL